MIKSWAIIYVGILSLSIGMWIHSGVDIGLITYGLCLIASGLTQYLLEK